jgi:acetyltransferase-like isoleucine patch superfamily enzyme
MEIFVLDGGFPDELQPLSCTYTLAEFPVAGKALREQLQGRFSGYAEAASALTLTLHPALWPSENLMRRIIAAKEPCRIVSSQLGLLGWINDSQEAASPEAASLELDAECLQIRYPWDLLGLNEILVAAISEDCIRGTIREMVSYEGCLELGEGSVLLPGVYIEGNVRIGKHCKIGPNCYLRGNTCIGDYCHVGQAVEIKNSLLLDHVSLGHLSYVGDSIIGPNTNFGAGTITANLRHDGKNHRSQVAGQLIDSQRRKFGAIVGANVHTGINTSIYPGRKIWPGACTRPGEIVSQDLHPVG